MPFFGLVTAGIIGGVGSLAGGLLGSSAAENAAQTQAGAATTAAQLQAQQAANALAFQKQVWQQQQNNALPFLGAGQQAVRDLSWDLNNKPQLNTTGALAGPANNLNDQWATPFVAPTAAQAAQTPGYQFMLQQGEQALERSAAAQGNLLTGGTARDLTNYAEGLASTDYADVYNRALGQYQQNYNIFEQNQANKFNRLASLSGIGQTAAGQLGQQGSAAAGINANTLLTSGAQIGQQITNAGAARASGYVGAANALGGALNNIGSLASVIPLYNAFNQNQGNVVTDPTGGLPLGG